MKQAQYRLLDRYKFCKDFTNFNKNQLIALVLIFIGCCWYFSSSYTFNVQKSRKINEELKRFKALLKQNSKANSSSCKVPQLDPWDVSILKYYKEAPALTCTPIQANVTYVENGYLKINKEFIGNVQCRYRYYGQDTGISDYEVRYEEWRDFESEAKIEQDFVEVECSRKSFLSVNFYKYHWNTIVPKITNLINKSIENSSNEKPSVIMMGIDSMSRSNFIRQLNKTYAVLQKLGFVDMKSHVKIWDNTYNNLLAVLLGKRGTPSREFPAEIPDSPEIYYDGFDFIWKNFSDQGYVTLLAEDKPDRGTFNKDYNTKGFKFQPVDHYMRPYWLAAVSSLLKLRSVLKCYDYNPEFTLHLNYIQQFLNNYKNKRKFAFWWTQDLSHDDLNKFGVFDHDLAKFFETNAPNFEDSIVIVFSDHGDRIHAIRQTVVGRLESRYINTRGHLHHLCLLTRV
uniref:Uncharacterized protein n=1 Tax=Acrobeloides nanus TaxID=290746 RepID=A0A914D3E9_9BILA